MNYNRAFKGVWIPKEIWLNEDLNITEKIFLVEIESLDNGQGCYASNGHFADFFQMSKGRCSQIIKQLEKKGFVTIRYTRKEGSKEVDRRFITPTMKYQKEEGKENKEDIDPFNKLNTPFSFLNTPLKYSKYPPLENAQGNNTKSNNTKSNNTTATTNQQQPQQTEPGNKANVMKTWEQVGFGMITPFIIDSLQHWIKDFDGNEDVIAKAIEEAAKSNPRAPLKYTEGILKQWLRRGIKTVSDVDAEHAKHEKTKEAEPEDEAWAKQNAEALDF